MAACYAPDATFSDPVFPRLDAAGVRDVGMLCARGKDLRVVASDIDADDARSRALGRDVHVFGDRPAGPQRIDATFAFDDGQHRAPRDRFDLWRWTGRRWAKGAALGWAPP